MTFHSANDTATNPPLRDQSYPTSLARAQSTLQISPKHSSNVAHQSFFHQSHHTKHNGLEANRLNQLPSNNHSLDFDDLVTSGHLHMNTSPAIISADDSSMAKLSPSSQSVSLPTGQSPPKRRFSTSVSDNGPHLESLPNIIKDNHEIQIAVQDLEMGRRTPQSRSPSQITPPLVGVWSQTPLNHHITPQTIATQPIHHDDYGFYHQHVPSRQLPATIAQQPVAIAQAPVHLHPSHYALPQAHYSSPHHQCQQQTQYNQHYMHQERERTPHRSFQAPNHPLNPTQPRPANSQVLQYQSNISTEELSLQYHRALQLQREQMCVMHCKTTTSTPILPAHLNPSRLHQQQQRHTPSYPHHRQQQPQVQNRTVQRRPPSMADILATRQREQQQQHMREHQRWLSDNRTLPTRCSAPSHGQ